MSPLLRKVFELFLIVQVLFELKFVVACSRNSGMGECRDCWRWIFQISPGVLRLFGGGCCLGPDDCSFVD